jgi:putative transcriptional regulator
MTRSSSKARFARLGPTRAISRDRSGLPAALVLRPAGKRVETVTAALLLARHGLSMLRAKRAIETMLTAGEVVVLLPAVNDALTLLEALRAAGIKATRQVRTAVDVRALRERLDLTQEQFALRFGIDLDALQNWEQGRRVPDATVVAYLRVIARDPAAAAKAQEEEDLNPA